MEKIFLDYLYAKKHDILKKMELLNIEKANPQAQCCENMANVSEPHIRYQEKEKHLEDIEFLIGRYINAK